MDSQDLPSPTKLCWTMLNSSNIWWHTTLVWQKRTVHGTHLSLPTPSWRHWKICASDPRNLKIKDVKNGCSELKDISKNEKRGEIVFRHCGLTHTEMLDALEVDRSAGPEHIDPELKHQHHLRHLCEVQQLRPNQLNLWNIKLHRDPWRNHQLRRHQDLPLVLGRL